MTQPGRPSGTTADAALDSFFADLEHLGWEDLGRVAFPVDDPERMAARATAFTSAGQAGRGEDLDAARTAARAWVDGVYAARLYQPTWVALNWGRSTGSLQDRIAMTEVVEDAAIAAVVDDLVTPTVSETLREPLELVRSMHPAELATPAAERRWRWGRPVAVILLVFALTFFFADSVGWVGPIGLAIPVVMAALILVRLANVPPRA
jgi:hypothetical protein